MVNEESDLDTAFFSVRLLAEPAEATPSVDIVMVHGINGGARRTWCKNGDPSLFWPKYWLPQDVRNARIFTFSYNASSTPKDVYSILDFGHGLLSGIDRSDDNIGQNCPIVFIAHDLGGLVVKTAYLIAVKSNRSTVITKTRAMIFIGTPHRGSKSYKRFCPLIGKPKPYLDEIVTIPVAKRKFDEFQSLENSGLKFCTLYEDRPSRVTVEKTSAILGYKGEYVQGLNTSHGDLVKYSSRDDSSYQRLLAAVRFALE